MKLYGWNEQYGKCSYVISGLWNYVRVVTVCALLFCMNHSTCFRGKRRGFAVINIDNISYWVVKNMILRSRPCWVYPVGWSIWIYGGRVEVKGGQEGSIEPYEKLCRIVPYENLCQSWNYRSGGPRWPTKDDRCRWPSVKKNDSELWKWRTYNFLSFQFFSSLFKHIISLFCK